MLNPKKKKKVVNHKPPALETNNAEQITELISVHNTWADSIEKYNPYISTAPENAPVKLTNSINNGDLSVNRRMEEILQQVLQRENPSGRCNNIWKDEDW